MLRAIITIGNKDNSKTYTVYITHIGVRASTQNVIHQASIKIVACIYNIAETQNISSVYESLNNSGHV